MYIATFYSHFGAMRFKQHCEAKGISCILKPVPRDLSSSCGTCSQFTSWVPLEELQLDEIEQIVKLLGSGYEQLYVNQEE